VVASSYAVQRASRDPFLAPKCCNLWTLRRSSWDQKAEDARASYFVPENEFKERACGRTAYLDWICPLWPLASDHDDSASLPRPWFKDLPHAFCNSIKTNRNSVGLKRTTLPELWPTQSLKHDWSNGSPADAGELLCTVGDLVIAEWLRQVI